MSKQVTQTEWLVDWWEQVLSEPVDKRYIFLKYATSVRGRNEKLDRSRLKQLRKRFINDHVMRKRFRMSEKCFMHPGYNIEDTFMVRHHIISLKNWGCNRRLNIVTLCNRCHEYMHPWLRDK